MTKRNLDNIVFTENMESRLEKIPVNDLLNQHRSWLNREFLLSRRGTGKSPFSIVRLKAKIGNKLIFNRLVDEQVIIISSDIDIYFCPILQIDDDFVYNKSTVFYHHNKMTGNIDRVYRWCIDLPSNNLWFMINYSILPMRVSINPDFSLQTDTISVSENTLKSRFSSKNILEGEELKPGDEVYNKQAYDVWLGYRDILTVLDAHTSPGHVKVKHGFLGQEVEEEFPISKLTRIPPKKFIKIGERYVPAPITAIPGSEACTLYTVVRTSDGYEAAVVKLGPIDSKAERYVDRYKMPTIKTGYWKAYVDKGYHLDEDSAIAHAAALNAMYNTFYYKHED